jgi:hypothetical protein
VGKFFPFRGLGPAPKGGLEDLVNIFDDILPTLDTNRLYMPTFQEFTLVVRDFTTTEIFTIVGVVFWFIMLALPLTGIDRRDRMTGVTYLLYMTFGAAMLVLAVPGKFPHLEDGIWQLITLMAFAAAAALKWFVRKAPPIVIRVTDGSEGVDEKPSKQEAKP